MEEIEVRSEVSIEARMEVKIGMDIKARARIIVEWVPGIYLVSLR
jgi:hypothetical protein